MVPTFQYHHTDTHTQIRDKSWGAKKSNQRERRQKEVAATIKKCLLIILPMQKSLFKSDGSKIFCKVIKIVLRLFRNEMPCCGGAHTICVKHTLMGYLYWLHFTRNHSPKRCDIWIGVIVCPQT